MQYLYKLHVKLHCIIQFEFNIRFEFDIRFKFDIRFRIRIRFETKGIRSYSIRTKKITFAHP